MDWQQLPAIEGDQGFEYKISIIPMRTRMKYSEIHSQSTSVNLAQVLENAVKRLPPFFLVMTDNAMSFTMKYTHHPERKTAFQKKMQRLGLIHGTIRKGAPWQNGFIERSNRTDNDELFRGKRFRSAEDRKYQLRLWEMEYNHHRPHQGLGGMTPIEKFQQDYRNHPLACVIM